MRNLLTLHSEFFMKNDFWTDAVAFDEEFFLYAHERKEKINLREKISFIGFMHQKT